MAEMARVEWRVPFSEVVKRGHCVSHILVAGPPKSAVAYRLCMPQRIVNPALSEPEGQSVRCRNCIAIERARTER